MPYLGIGLCLIGLGLVALTKSLSWIHIGTYMVLGGIVWLLSYMVLHKGDWEK